MNSMAVGVDIAKQVFQVHYVDRETGEIVNKAIKRAKFLEHFANRAACLIGMEACGGAHHWARQLTQMGHEVRLMPAEFVKCYVAWNLRRNRRVLSRVRRERFPELLRQHRETRRL
ncbi:hypothetical protein WK57_18320 [Burkholderia ubonensis]|uniref:Transposase n=1 Tax=Burkholderia ubonensis TaxID=101571 RepID=A0AA40R9M6_9BURK|nr:hypothetical protein WK57_18320 [Burkholderia ubonensis]